MTGSVVLVGGLGKTGRRVHERLTARGIASRPASRSTPIPFDWTEPAGWAQALAGAQAAYVVYLPDLEVAGSAEDVAAFAQVAAQEGLERLVLLSGRGEPGARAAEQALADAFPWRWTVVRCAWFAQGLSEDAFADGVRAGELVLPQDCAPEPWVDLEDVADVVVAALTQDGHDAVVHELTGPHSLSFAEVARELAAAREVPVAHVPVTLEAWCDGARAAGAPEEHVALLAHLFAELFDGRNATPTDGVRRALGRPPGTFAAYARRAAAMGAWG